MSARPAVMPALVAGVHVLMLSFSKQGVDGRDKPGHEAGEVIQHGRN